MSVYLLKTKTRRDQASTLFSNKNALYDTRIRNETDTIRGGYRRETVEKLCPLEPTGDWSEPPAAPAVRRGFGQSSPWGNQIDRKLENQSINV